MSSPSSVERTPQLSANASSVQPDASSSVLAALEADYRARWARDRARVRWIGRGINVLSVVILCTLFYYLLVRENYSYGLIAMSFFFIFTRLSGFIAYRRFLVADALLALRDGTPDQQAAAARVVDAHRVVMLRDLRRERLESSSPEALASLDLNDIKTWKELDNVAWWARFATGWAIAWCVAAIGVISLLIAIW